MNENMFSNDSEWGKQQQQQKQPTQLHNPENGTNMGWFCWNVIFLARAEWIHPYLAFKFKMLSKIK